MFTNSLIESTREGRLDARQQLRPDDGTQLSAAMAVNLIGICANVKAGLFVLLHRGFHASQG
jgi:hypothetical protein